MGGVAGLAIVVVAVWWFLKKRGKRCTDVTDDTNNKAPEQSRVELPLQEKPITPPPRELDAGARSITSELPGQQGMSEMPA